MRIHLNPNPNPATEADRNAKIAEGGFGKYYTDNMLIAQWSEGKGWSDAELKAYGPLSLDPATSVLHYGQEIFEGLKAYGQPDGGISLFRPDANGERFAKSAARMALPELPVEDFVKTVTELVKSESGIVNISIIYNHTAPKNFQVAFLIIYNYIKLIITSVFFTNQCFKNIFHYFH